MIAWRKPDRTLFTVLVVLFIIALAIGVWTGTWYTAAVPFALAGFYLGWQQQKAVFFLLLFSIPFSAEIMITPALGTDFPDELLMLFTATLFFFYAVFSPVAFSGRVLQHPLIVTVIVVWFWAAITSLFSHDHLLSTKYLLAKCWYMGAFILAPIIVWRNDKKAMRASGLLIAMAILLVTTITMVRHFSYGFSFANINDALQPFFRNHVNYSAMLACAIPLFFAWYKLEIVPRKKFWLIVIMLFLSTALFLSYSRGAWLAIVAGAVAYWLIQKRMIMITYVVVVVSVIGLLFWIKEEDRYLHYAHDYRTTIFHENFSEHLRATYQLKDMSSAERFYRWIAGVRMIKDEPLTGFGPSTFYDNYKPYAIPAFKTWVSANPEHSTVHNYYLMITIEQGVPALILFLILTGLMLYYSQHLYHRVNDPFYRVTTIIAGVIIVILLVVNFLSDMIETDKVGSLFYLCLSWLAVTDVNTRKDSYPSPDIKRVS